jgi:histidinol-phosphatase
VSWDKELAAAHRWLDDADRTALTHFRAGVSVEAKPDGTPVTEADRAIEAALRRAIEREFRGDAVVGEEEGSTGSGNRRWVIDPIDATKNFVRGIPIFATLLGLEVDGHMVLGLASAPVLRTRWWATAGGGAFREGDPIHVSSIGDLAAATIASGGLDSIAKHAGADGFASLATKAARQRGFGDFWGHMLVAQGSVDAMVDPVVAFHDVAPLQPIVTEAGGRMTTLGGAATPGGSCVSTNGALHDEVLAILAGS